MGDREKVIDSVVVIEETAEGWSVKESLQIAAATMSTSVVLEKETLFLKKIVMTGGPVRCDVDIQDGRAKGLVKVSMQEDRTVDCATGGELFASPAGQREAIAALPLAEGYAKTLRTFNPVTEALKETPLVVTGIESNCFVVDVGEGQWKLWVDCDTRDVVRSVILQPNGMTVISELLPAID
jgi:hypothetical protein